MAVATCEPTVQASGCRPQKLRKSPTVAEAAEMASEALTSLPDALRCAAPKGNRTRTSPSQNVIRNKKNMRLASPTAAIAARAFNLAGSFESRVGGTGIFFLIIEDNTPQIFAQVEKMEFT